MQVFYCLSDLFEWAQGRNIFRPKIVTEKLRAKNVSPVQIAHKFYTGVGWAFLPTKTILMQTVGKNAHPTDCVNSVPSVEWL